MLRTVVFVALLLCGGLVQAAGIAASADAVTPALIGSSVPDVVVQGLDGSNTTLKQRVAGKPSVIVFYRGGWCPFCNMQLSKLSGIEAQLTGLGYQVIAVTPDEPEQIQHTLDKDKLKLTILSDSKLAAIKAFGIGFYLSDDTQKKYHDYGIELPTVTGESGPVLPVPSVFIADAKGVIQFVYVNPDYRIRLTPELLMAAAKASLDVKPLQPAKSG